MTDEEKLAEIQGRIDSGLQPLRLIGDALWLAERLRAAWAERDAALLTLSGRTFDDSELQAAEREGMRRAAGLACDEQCEMSQVPVQRIEGCGQVSWFHVGQSGDCAAAPIHEALRGER